MLTKCLQPHRSQDTEFYLINPLTGYNHLTCSRSRRGRCEVIARVKSGPHHRGCMVNTWSHFHTWCLPQRKTQTSKPDISSVKKNGLDPTSAGQNNLLSPGGSALASQVKRMSHYSVAVDWMLIFFFRGCQRTVVFQSVPSSITYVLFQTLATAKTKREKFI